MGTSRGSKLKVFEGIQIICIGGFGPLGCIPKGMTMMKLKTLVKDAIVAGRDPAVHLLRVSSCCAFAFQSVFWREAMFKYVTLQKDYRLDPTLRKVMNNLRDHQLKPLCFVSKEEGRYDKIRLNPDLFSICMIV